MLFLKDLQLPFLYLPVVRNTLIILTTVIPTSHLALKRIGNQKTLVMIWISKELLLEIITIIDTRIIA